MTVLHANQHILRGNVDKLVNKSNCELTKIGHLEAIEFSFIQTWSNDYKRLLNKPYVNEVYLIGQNLT